MTNMLYLPRRHCRPLLFPPGLLALAWLLWLGCAALPQMRGMQPRQGAMSLFIYPANYCVGFDFLPCTDRPMPPLLSPVCYPSERLETFRCWQDVVFTGSLWVDYFSYQQLQLALQRVQNTQNFHLNIMIGLRVHFSSKATYSSLVYSLDALKRYEAGNYWLDIYRRPTTLYVFISNPSDNYMRWAKQPSPCSRQLTYY
jgi:hypothetical protein